METKQKFDVIDLTKFIGSILIFMIHMNALGDFEPLVIPLEIITRWCVPFFFVTSSYFLFSKSDGNNIDRKTLNNYLRRIGLLYLTYFIINLPNIVCYRLINEGIGDIHTWINFAKGTLLTSTFTGSWYLNSSLFSAFFIYILSRKMNTGKVLVITGFIQIICILTSVYRGLLPTGAVNILVGGLLFPINSFGGVFYFAIGKYIAENREKFRTIPNTVCISVFLIAYAVFFAEVYLAENKGYIGLNDVGAGIVFASVALFLILIKSKVTIKNNIVLRKLSTIIYCGQANVLLLSRAFRKYFDTSYAVMFLFGSFLLAVFAAAVFFLKKWGKFKWAKYLT
ncbi:MAG: acyltransferase [Ruminococcus sp.]|nr:acyltransferase [Ruminococcus sp.]